MTTRIALPPGERLTGSHYRHVAKITWRGVFPAWDMLRYDDCHPCKSEDAVAIAAGYPLYGPPPPGGRSAYIERISPHKSASAAWTYDRWRSFGVLCVAKDRHAVREVNDEDAEAHRLMIQLPTERLRGTIKDLVDLIRQDEYEEWAANQAIANIEHALTVLP